MQKAVLLRHFHRGCLVLFLQVALLSTASSLPSDVPPSALDSSGTYNNQGTFYSSQSPPPSQGSSGLNGGQIAGIVIGSIAGAMLVAAVTAAGVIRYRRHRAGWRKDELDGASPGQLDAAFGVNPMPTSVGAAAPNAAAEAGMGHNGAPLQYPHSPYNVRSAAPGAIEMQNSAERHGSHI